MTTYAETQLQIEALIKETYIPQLKPMEVERPEWHTRTSADILHVLGRDIEHEHTFGRDLGHYPYIAYDAHRFVNVLSELRQRFKDNGQFIDVGCGIGDKLLLANKMCGFSDVSGIEYDPTSVEIAKATVGGIAKQIIHADANEVDFSTYNMVYLYCPIQNIRLMRKLYVHIAKTAPEGAIIAEMYPTYANNYSADQMSPVFKNLFKRLIHTYGFVYQKQNAKLHHIEVNFESW